jgi:hypothetical protein
MAMAATTTEEVTMVAATTVEEAMPTPSAATAALQLL